MAGRGRGYLSDLGSSSTLIKRFSKVDISCGKHAHLAKIVNLSLNPFRVYVCLDQAMPKVGKTITLPLDSESMAYIPSQGACLVRLNSNSMEVVRAVALSIVEKQGLLKPHSVRVYLVDSGKFDHVLAENVFSIDGDYLSYPPLAIKCEMYNLRNIESEAGTLLEKLFANKMCAVVFRHYDSVADVFDAEIFSTFPAADGSRLDFALALVSRGFATWICPPIDRDLDVSGMESRLRNDTPFLQENKGTNLQDTIIEANAVKASIPEQYKKQIARIVDSNNNKRDSRSSSSTESGTERGAVNEVVVPEPSVRPPVLNIRLPSLIGPPVFRFPAGNSPSSMRPMVPDSGHHQQRQPGPVTRPLFNSSQRGVSSSERVVSKPFWLQESSSGVERVVSKPFWLQESSSGGAPKSGIYSMGNYKLPVEEIRDYELLNNCKRDPWKHNRDHRGEMLRYHKTPPFEAPSGVPILRGSISYIISPAEFYLRLNSKATKFAELSTKLNEFLSQSPPLAEARYMVPGCMLLYAGPNGGRRVSVLSAPSEGFAKVQYLDEGIIQRVPLQRLHMISEDISRYPLLVFPCGVYNDRFRAKVLDWTPEETDMFCDIVDPIKDRVQCEFYEYDRVLNRTFVKILDEDERDICQELLAMKMSCVTTIASRPVPDGSSGDDPEPTDNK